jgi:hypothetical protein
MERSPEIELNDEENASSTVESMDTAAPAPQRPSIVRKDIAEMVDDPDIVALAYKAGAPKTKFIVLPIKAINRTCRLRALQSDKLPNMAERLKQNTILHPPAVRWTGAKTNSISTGMGWVLVTGGHRVEAELLNGSTHMVFRIPHGSLEPSSPARLSCGAWEFRRTGFGLTSSWPPIGPCMAHGPRSRRSCASIFIRRFIICSSVCGRC